MKFDYDDECDAYDLVLSSSEEKLIKSKTRELKKLCYKFKCFDFDELNDCMGDEEDEDECDFTCIQVADELEKVLPFVKEKREKIFDMGLFTELLHEIQSNLDEDVTVSVLDSPLDKDDIQEDMSNRFEYYEIIGAFFQFCDRETACKVYDFLQKETERF